MQFHDRVEAGRWLALELTKYKDRSDVVILALQGGGIPIANEISRSLKAPADILVIHKLRLATQPDVIIGALTSGGVQVLNQTVVQQLQLTPFQIEQMIGWGKVELEHKEQKYRDARPFSEVKGKTVIVVDDGIFSGSSMRVALEALAEQHPAQIVMAVPVAPPTIYTDFNELVDEIICLMTPQEFGKVHDYYAEYHTISDEEIHKLLEWAYERLVHA